MSLGILDRFALFQILYNSDMIYFCTKSSLINLCLVSLIIYWLRFSCHLSESFKIIKRSYCVHFTHDLLNKSLLFHTLFQYYCNSNKIIIFTKWFYYKVNTKRRSHKNAKHRANTAKPGALFEWTDVINCYGSCIIYSNSLSTLIDRKFEFGI